MRIRNNSNFTVIRCSLLLLGTYVPIPRDVLVFILKITLLLKLYFDCYFRSSYIRIVQRTKYLKVRMIDDLYNQIKSNLSSIT